MSDIEQRIQRLEDRAAIEDLVVRYFVATDDDDYDTLESQFTPDAVFKAGNFTGGKDRQSIVAFLREARASMGVTIHTPNYCLVTFEDNDHASGIVGAHLEIAMAGQSLFGAVRYIDKYSRLEGRWQFSKRELKTFHMGPWSDVASSLTSELKIRWPGTPPQTADLPYSK